MMSRKGPNCWLARFASLCTAASVLCLPAALHAHGAWLGNGTVDYTIDTQTLLQTRVNSGAGGFQNNDFIELIASFPVIVNGTVSGPGGYITFYVPPGTEVAGAWIVNAAASPISARPATSLASGEGTDDGWGPLGQPTFFTGINGWSPGILPSGCSNAALGIAYTAANCASAMTHLYGDTGIFYSTRADTAMYTGSGTVISLVNGYQTNPTNAQPWPSVGGGGNERVHNKWDAVQTNAFGSTGVIANGFSAAEETVLSNGRGTTPFNAGSPVAGPDSGNRWDRYATNGPWNRVSYSGSCFGGSAFNKAANGIGSTLPTSPAINAVNSVNACTPTLAGYVVSDGNRLPPGTNTVRFAVGGITQGETHRVKVRLKVTNAVTLGVANFEGHGGDSTQGAKASNDNPWRYWIGAPATAPLANARLPIKKSIVAINGIAYAGTDIPPAATVRYRISYANGYAQPQTNVTITDVLQTQATAVSGYQVISGPNILPANLASGIITFAPIASLLPGQGGAVEFDVATNAAAGQTLTNTGRIVSTQVTTIQTSVASANVSIPPPLSVTKVSGIFSDGISIANPKGIPGALVSYTIAVTNPGAAAPDNGSIIITDPTPAGLAMHVTDIGVAGNGPVSFIDGAPTSNLSYSFLGLGSAADDIQFSNDGGLSWAYSPVPDANGDDASITHVRIAPKGVMNPSSSFQVLFRYRMI
jgi:large repetitive protein